MCVTPMSSAAATMSPTAAAMVEGAPGKVKLTM
jgi:hypothetical protein